MRSSIRWSAAIGALRSARATRTSLAQRNASTTLANSTSNPSSIVLTIRSWRSAILGHQLGPDSPEPFQGSALIGSDQPRIAGDIGGEDRGKSAGLAHVGTAGQALVPILIQPMTAPHFFFDRRAGR